MTQAQINAPPAASMQRAQIWLARTGAIWFIFALIGQAIFAVHIFATYWTTAFAGNWQHWTDNLFTGIIEGDLLGNALMVVHFTLALIITLSGPLQLIPALRKQLPQFHRWNGRIYILVALIISVGATALIWVRPAFGGPINAALQSFNGAVIFLCALLAFHSARRKNFASHRRWATRLFLAVSGVWFLRVMMIAWAIPTGGAGLGEQLDGPMGRAAMLGQTVIPLAVYQLYLMAETSGSARMKLAMTILLSVLTILMIGGIAGASFAMWLPSLMG